MHYSKLLVRPYYSKLPAGGDLCAFRVNYVKILTCNLRDNFLRRNGPEKGRDQTFQARVSEISTDNFGTVSIIGCALMIAYKRTIIY